MPLRPEITLDLLNHRGDGRLPGLIGFRVIDLEDGLLAAELDIRPESAGAQRLPARGHRDRACRHRVRLRLPRASAAGAQNFTTVELKANFFCDRARRHDRAQSRGRSHLGNTTQVWDAEVTRKADGRQIALFRCTQIVLWPK